MNRYYYYLKHMLRVKTMSRLQLKQNKISSEKNDKLFKKHF